MTLIDPDHIRPVPHGLGTNLELWQLDLDDYAAHVALDGLSAHEHARATRMAFGRDARRYLACRHALRRVLAGALDRSVQSVEIESDEFDKPHLGGGGRLQFNVSHSEHVGLIALSRDSAVGVDIEMVRSIVEADALARSHFTTAELGEWMRAAEPLRHQTFLDCWTRKEACLKALGVGLSAPPACVDAGCSPEVRAISVRLGARRCAVTVYPLHVSSGMVAAVALAGIEAATLAREYFRQS
jgi:4'-phosphopantetheinyl transferase